ncbi:response regulator [Stappia sediminis]|uniref:response regulator n=1 Tax=Stappia sediminis TaxID=2692190 RepID=UPI0028AE95FC|nr:response regulator [Stappia sediminis]
MTIHIVEDDPGVSDALALLLASIGHETATYPDAESFFEVNPPGDRDTVIVDLGLPGLTGIQVIRWVKRLKHQPRVIAISGQSSRAIDRLLDGETADVLLRKPLQEETLLRHL